MITSISSLAATEHVADLRRVAEDRRRVAEARRPHEPYAYSAASPPAVSLRFAGVADEQVVRDLAALDDAPAPDGEVLLALIDGEAVAAMSCGDGRVVANPFVHTQAAVALLRLRAEHVASRRAHRGRPFVLRPRFG